MGNLLRSFMSAWMVGNVDAPPKANIIDENAVKNPDKVGSGLIGVHPSSPEGMGMELLV